MTEPRLK